MTIKSTIAASENLAAGLIAVLAYAGRAKGNQNVPASLYAASKDVFRGVIEPSAAQYKARDILWTAKDNYLDAAIARRRK